MAYSKVDDTKTYVTINIHCNCYGCQGNWKRYGKILGVESVRVDDEGKKVIILIIGDSKKLKAKLKEQKKMYSTYSDPKKLIEKLKEQEKVFSKKRIEELNEKKKVFELVDRTFQKMQIVLHQQPALKALEIDKSIVKNSQGPCGKHCYELEKNKQFTCDGCKEKGCGSRYKCKHCGSVRHKECVFHKHSISPEIFSRYTFEFCRRPSRPRSCDACGNYIKGYFYACNERNLALHPCCSNLKDKLHSGGMDFILHKKVSSSSKCKWCNQKTPFGTKTRNPGCSYVSKCNEYHFHVYCITQMVHEAGTNGDIDGSTIDLTMALEKMDLKLVQTKNRNGGSGGNNIWSTISMFISTIASCLLGDPTTVLVPLFTGLCIKLIPKLFLK
ncbi:unnamed protein product [Camellia sinensis]